MLSPSHRFNNRFQIIRDLILSDIKKGILPSLSIAVAEKGKIVWEEAFGLLNNGTPVTPNTMFHLASVSKTLTATGLMTLVEDGLVDLEVPVNDYLGSQKIVSYIGNPEEVTVKHLLRHQAGLPPYCEFFYPTETYPIRDIEETIRRYGIIMFPPGENYIYCNLGFMIIAHLISNVSKKSFNEYMQEKVFKPLEMTRTEVNSIPQDMEDIAVPIDPQGGSIPPYKNVYPGADDIYCSIHDLIRFGMFHLKNNVTGQKQIISNDFIGEMQNNYERYGLGWIIDVDELGYRTVYHGGDSPGSTTFLRLFPSDDTVFAILCNNKYSNLYNLQDSLAKILVPELDREKKVQESSGKVVFPSELFGVWKGIILAYDRKIPVFWEINAEKVVKLQLIDQPESEIYSTEYNDGYLFCYASGSIPTEDNERLPHTLRFVVKHKKNILEGMATAFGVNEQNKGTHELSAWINLQLES